METEFEWDPEKADENQQKHGIDFGEAMSVFADPLLAFQSDHEHSHGEERFMARDVGSAPSGRRGVYSTRQSREEPLCETSLHERLDGLVAEVCWLARDGRGDAEASPGERLAHYERLERIGREADALRDAISEQVEQRLMRAGMSRQEIEQKTEETARLWLAA